MIGKYIRICAAGFCVVLLTFTPMSAVLADNSIPFPTGTISVSPSPTPTPDRYVGDGDIEHTDFRSATLTQTPRFIGRVDAHDAHMSGPQVSGHVSWTLVSGTSRKMEIQSTLKAKTSWFGYLTKASSGRVSVWPEGGRGKAAVARYTCTRMKNTEWYTYGEGFAPGTQKPWGHHEGTVKNLPCGV